MEKQEEAKLRDLIRKELETREEIKGSEYQSHRERQRAQGLSEERQRIIEDEIRNFHRDRGNAREFINDEGDVEWLTEDEIIEREMQLPVDMEELEAGQRHIRNRIVLLSLLLFAGLVLMFVSLSEKTGNVQVICNVPRATIHLNGAPTEYLTDFTLKGLPMGAHLLSVSKPGFIADGAHGAKAKVMSGEDAIVILKLKPEPAREAVGQR